MNEYLTIKKYAVSKIEIEKSVFIGVVYPIRDEEEIDDCLQDTRIKYPNATHYVYAYTVGRNQLVQKFSDDGEPSGTGGMPILEIFKHRQLENILVIVVRYYGGTKLGTGGLKRAYSKAALEAIELSGIKKLTLCRLVHIRCPYTHWGKVQYELESTQTLIENIDYQEDVFIAIAIPLDKMISFTDWINGITASQVVIEEKIKSYREMKVD